MVDVPTRKSRARKRAEATGTALDHGRVPVTCQKCGEQSLEPLAELVVNDTVDCPDPECRNTIDLTTPEWKERLKKQTELKMRIKKLQ
jgi:hypothetical protein